MCPRAHVEQVGGLTVDVNGREQDAALNNFGLIICSFRAQKPSAKQRSNGARVGAVVEGGVRTHVTQKVAQSATQFSFIPMNFLQKHHIRIARPLCEDADFVFPQSRVVM